MHILLMEDTPGRSHATAAGLERFGFEMHCPENMQQALARLRHPGIDIVVMHVSLPHETVMQPFQQLRAVAPFVPILVLIEQEDHELSLQFIKYGAQDCLVQSDTEYDTMARCLEFAVERNRHMAAGFVRDITETRRSNEELERLVHARTELLTRSNEELRQFAKIASHDLQEPLRAVEGFTNLLAECTQGKLEKNCEEFIEFILDGVVRMQHLVRSILMHSQITVDNSITDDSDCNSVIREVLSDFNEDILETDTEILLDDLPKVAVEHSHMVQLFQNLIGNSIKYRGSSPPKITVSAERTLNQWLFSVSDNSIGIDPQYSEKIFDMFYRLHAKNKYPGTGMGLAICKRIVVSHGGAIWVESKPGQGSIFFFTLPAIDKETRPTMNNKIQILLAEDTPSDVRLIQEALKRTNLKYELNIVNDGVEAMEYLHKQKDSSQRLPDIVLLDLNMPRKNGHDVLLEMKNDVVLNHIPVVLLTVSERDEDVLESLRLKMNYYIAKPVTAEKLSVLIGSIHDLYTKEPSTAEHSTAQNHVRLVLAGNPHTAPIALEKLAADASEKVRGRVAENVKTPETVLQKLATDFSPEVRLSVSENPSAPNSVLEILAEDPDDDVRLGISSNPRVSTRILRTLAADSNMYVSASAKKTLANFNKEDKK